MNLIDQSFEMQIGDVYQMDFQILSIWQQSQIDYIMDSLNDDGRVSINSYSIDPAGVSWLYDTLHITATVNRPMSPLVVLITLIVGIIAAGILLNLLFDKAYLISRVWTGLPDAAVSHGSTSIADMIKSVGTNTMIIFIVIGVVFAVYVFKVR